MPKQINKDKVRNISKHASYEETPKEGQDMQQPDEAVEYQSVEVEETPVVNPADDKLHTYGEIKTKVDLSSVFSKISPAGVICLESILTYVNEMGEGKPQTLKSGANYQQMLFNALDTLFNRLDKTDFGLIYNAFLLIVSERTGKGQVFHDDMIYRFAEEWPMDDLERVAYRRWLTMIAITANPATRGQQLKEIPRFDTFLDYGLTPEAKQQLRNFYRVD